jgi:hypothetical protein
MSNELNQQKSWWKTHWKWIVPLGGLLLIVVVAFFSSGMSKVGVDLAQAYADTDLYDGALEKVNSHPKATDLLGELEPMDKLAILEGEVQYSNNNLRVNSTVKITGSKGSARMDITADKINEVWIYSKIKLRIKTPPEKKQHIDIYTKDKSQLR